MGFITTAWIVLGSLNLVATVSGYGHGAKFNYGDNPLGPDNWPKLFPHQCAGFYQSPIDIQTYRTIYDSNLGEFQFTQPTPGSRFIVRNVGHYIQVDTEGYFYVWGGGLRDTYKTVQFHFHWGDSSSQGAEHRVDGRGFPIEMHVVNFNYRKYNSLSEASKHPDGIAVLSVLFEVSPFDNPWLEPIIQAIPYVRDPELNNKIEIPATSIRNLLPGYDSYYYRYWGSLTTPLCLESVTWTVFQQVMPISERQLNVFRSVLAEIHLMSETQEPYTVKEQMVNNYRPIQPLNNRYVYRSFDYEE